jgi:prolyl-tRNA synthetase
MSCRGGYGKETLKVEDRHGREMIYGPTHEEVITDIFRKSIKSQKELPVTLYQIQWKFRDEIRPRFGVMRGREFLMKDAYTFTLDEASHIELYYKMYETYLKIFRRMGLTAIPFRAETGLIGGNLSHEFQVVAETGESEIYFDKAFEDAVASDTPDIEAMKELYSAADELHDPANCPVPADQLKKARGIEVGHIFYFDTKYSDPMGAKVSTSNDGDVTVKMGAHGIGVSRLVGAIIEASHDEAGIIWPESVAPFKVGLLNLRQGDDTCDTMCNSIYQTLQEKRVSVLYDDTEARGGAKFSTMDLIGLPWQVIVGPKSAAEGMIELKHRQTGERETISLESVLERLASC